MREMDVTVFDRFLSGSHSRATHVGLHMNRQRPSISQNFLSNRASQKVLNARRSPREPAKIQTPIQ